MEAAEAGIGVIVAITEGVPFSNMARVARFLKERPGSSSSARTAPDHHARTSARSASCPATFTSRGPSA